MMNHKTSLALLLLSGCVAEPESGIDRTFIRGTVELPPGAFVESETKDSTNNDAKTAQELGYITTRYTIVQGNVRSNELMFMTCCSLYYALNKLFILNCVLIKFKKKFELYYIDQVLVG